MPAKPGEPVGHQPPQVHTSGIPHSGSHQTTAGGHLLSTDSHHSMMSGGNSHPVNQVRSSGTPQQSGSNAAVAQLFARLQQEIDREKPPNCIHFIVGFLCKHYPEHLHGFASIWQADPDLERERHEVVNFFKSHKISTAVAAHFTNAGFDTLDTLTTLNPDALVDVEAFNNVKWLPGHKVRLQQIFSEISARVRAYKQQHMGTSYVGAPVTTVSAPIASVATPLSPGLVMPQAQMQPSIGLGGYPGGGMGMANPALYQGNYQNPNYKQ